MALQNHRRNHREKDAQHQQQDRLAFQIFPPDPRAQRLEALSRTDDLTRVYNRRYLLEQLEQEIVRSRRYGYPLSLAILDMDNFKLVNDRHGHIVGDEVLSEFALQISEHLRRSDILGRYGGEEFGIIFTHTPLQKAVNVCNVIRRLIKKIEFGSCGTSITVSIGVALLEEDMQMKDLIETADKSMYQGKANGRDRVVSLQNDTELSG